MSKTTDMNKAKHMPEKLSETELRSGKIWMKTRLS